MADQTAARAYAYDLRVETAPMLCWDGSFPDTIPHIVSIDARFDDVDRQDRRHRCAIGETRPGTSQSTARRLQQCT